MCMLFAAAPSHAQVTPVQFLTGLTSVTDITHCGDERLFIVERLGRIRISDLSGNLAVRPFLDIDPLVNASGMEQGLLGLAFSPSYKTDGCFYVNYINNLNNTVISRFRVSANDPDSADAASEEILFTVTQPYSNHNGGSLQFGPDGYLYISLGDGGAGGDPQNYAQNRLSLLGKILRIDVTGPSGYQVPASNPFYGSVTTDPRIWALGLRNAWRTSFDRLTGDFWIADVGQNLREEVNVQPAGDPGGANYGWRCYEGLLPFNTNGCLGPASYVYPVHEYPHGPACSVTGGFVYRGAVHGDWFGMYFYADYCSGAIVGLEKDLSGNYVTTPFGSFLAFNYTTFGEDVYGELYLGTFYNGVYKLKGDSCPPVAHISFADTIYQTGSSIVLSTPFAPGYAYQWMLNGALLTGQNNHTLNTDINGNYSVTVTSPDGCSATSETVVVRITRDDNSVVVFPNPGISPFQANSQLFKQRSVRIEIYDAEGKHVYGKEHPGDDHGFIKIDLPGLSTGVYVIRFTVAGTEVNTRLIVRSDY